MRKIPKLNPTSLLTTPSYQPSSESLRIIPTSKSTGAEFKPIKLTLSLTERPYLSAVKLETTSLLSLIAYNFIIDEDLKNYNSIQKWIRRNGNDGADTTVVPSEPEYSDGRLLITTSNYQVKIAAVFRSLFPISLTSIPFDATLTDQEYFTANVVFKYHNYMITDKNLNEL